MKRNPWIWVIYLAFYAPTLQLIAHIDTKKVPGVYAYIVIYFLLFHI